MIDKWKTYLFEYNHDGSIWCLEIKASSPEDAQERLNRLPYARYMGTMQMTLPVETGIFARLLCWLQNRLAPRP